MGGITITKLGALKLKGCSARAVDGGNYYELSCGFTIPKDKAKEDAKDQLHLIRECHRALHMLLLGDEV